MSLKCLLRCLRLTLTLGAFLITLGFTLPHGAEGVGANVEYVDCENYQAMIETAFSDMAAAAEKVNETVSTWTCADWEASPAATNFMGVSCTDSSLQTVKSIIQKTSDFANGPTTITIDCSGTNTCVPGQTSPCQLPDFKDKIFAFHCQWPQDPKILVCPNNFFTRPNINDPFSQETILYHEVTHWAGTVDITECKTEECLQCGGSYNCGQCVNVAKSDPAVAQKLANSYMLFAYWIASGSNPCGAGGIALSLLVGGTLLYRKRRTSRRATIKRTTHE